MPADFDQVTLTKEEEEYAIWDARCAKYFELKAQEEKRIKAKELQDAVRPFTSTELRDFILANNPHFQVDDQAREVFELLTQYFSEDPAFEKEGRSLKKGLLLSGPVGVGKTELLKIFRRNKRQCFHLVSVFDLESSCQENGVDYFRTYTGYVPGWGGNKNCFFQRNIGWAFDDAGRESVVFDFGNKSDILSKIIQTRYLAKENIPFHSLHLTTNLTPDEMEARYDYAVRSRLREMFNYITVKGRDRRK